MSQIFLLDRFLFDTAGNWIPNSGPDINNPPSKVFTANQTDEGMVVENGLDQPYGGALVSNTGALYTVNGKLLNYSAWYYEFRFLPETYKNLARFENDNKECIKTRPNSTTKIRNVANFSTQWNRDTGQFQIDHDPPAWVNSGYVPSAKVTTPDDWHHMDLRYSFNETATTFSIESVQWDDEFYQMPAQHKNILCTNTNWEQCRKLQCQTEGYYAGTVLVEYRNGVLVWSDQLITGPIPQQDQYGDEDIVHKGRIPSLKEMKGWTVITRLADKDRKVIFERQSKRKTREDE